MPASVGYHGGVELVVRFGEVIEHRRGHLEHDVACHTAGREGVEGYVAQGLRKAGEERGCGGWVKEHGNLS